MNNRYETFTILVNNINRNIRKIKNEAMKDFNLKSHHVSCLYFLYKRKTLTSAELTELCDEDKAAISRSLDYLENNGYIICESRDKKRYKRNYQLTEKGNEVGAFICEKIDKVLEKSNIGLSKQKLTIFYEGLNLINENLDNIVKKGEQ